MVFPKGPYQPSRAVFEEGAQAVACGWDGASFRRALASIWRMRSARHGEILADFLERVLAAVLQAKGAF